MLPYKINWSLRISGKRYKEVVDGNTAMYAGPQKGRESAVEQKVLATRLPVRFVRKRRQEPYTLVKHLVLHLKECMSTSGSSNQEKKVI